MGVMGIPMRAVLAMAMVLLCGSVAVAFDGYNGLPRPAGMDQAPTTTYGPKPAVEYGNKAAKCIWYGWENGNYPPDGTHNCSTSLWASLSASNPAGLSGFMYYVPLEAIYFDPSYNEYLCAIGCFDLTAAPSPAAGPTVNPPAESPALPPTVPLAAPPVIAAPPPALTTAPPSRAAVTPPPATLFQPPPPAAPRPPSPAPTLIQVPPIALAPSPPISPETSPVSSPESSPIFSPGTGPVSSPGTGPVSSPGTGPGPTAGGPPNVIQGGSATTTSVPTGLVFTAALFLCINFLV